jgi:class 3 adenylate cyclase
MFADLVGSTALSAQLDPEDLRDLLATYHRMVSEVVKAHGGHVAQYLGDGALIYFGYPMSHENDGERALKTGLSLLERTRGLPTHGAEIRIRVGLATGLVVVGDKAVGSDAAHEPRIMGETPNIAARLQGIARPGEIVIAESTRQLVGSLFAYESLGPLELER